MRIKVTEPTGIRHEGLGHLKFEETHDVPDNLGKFFVANGWAVDTVRGGTAQGKRGTLDYNDPNSWHPGKPGVALGKEVPLPGDEEDDADDEEEKKPPVKKGTIKPHNTIHRNK